jgi:hypothetical protein
MKSSSKIFVEKILATLRRESIRGIWEIKSFKLTSDLKKNPIIKRFITLANDLIDRDSSGLLLYDVLVKLEDFFQCIIKGYYSTNNLDLLQRISDFLEVYIEYSMGILGAATYYIESDEGFMLDYESLVEQGIKEIDIDINDNKLSTSLRDLNVFNDFF